MGAHGRTRTGLCISGISLRCCRETFGRDISGLAIEQGELKAALENAFELVRFGNKYFDTEKPWATRLTDAPKCENTIFNCVALIANLAALLKPFLPFSSEKIQLWLGASAQWKPQFIASGATIAQPEILFERLDRKVAEEEIGKLNNR